MTATVIELWNRRNRGADPAASVRAARGGMSREAFATVLSPLLGWPAKPGMVRAWESGVPVPSDVVAACRTDAVREAGRAEVPEAYLADERDALILPGHDPAAADGTELTAWITATNTIDEAIEHIERIAAALAEMHTQVPDRKVLADVIQLHRAAQLLLRGGRQGLRPTREIVRLDGNVLAHASVLLSNLGESQAAENYGQAGLSHLQEAEACPATAWYALAKNARWQHNYAAAADLARQGLGRRLGRDPVTPMSVQLASYEANAAALLGDRTRALQALARAESIAERLPPAAANCRRGRSRLAGRPSSGCLYCSAPATLAVRCASRRPPKTTGPPGTCAIPGRGRRFASGPLSPTCSRARWTLRSSRWPQSSRSRRTCG